MNYSAQAILIDGEGNIYLERNKKMWNRLSFIGGKFEYIDNNSYENCVIREIREEMQLVLQRDRLLAAELQEPREILWKTWISTYFVVVLDELEWTPIWENQDIEIFDMHSLQRLDDDQFVLERITFLQQVQRALDCL